MDLLDVPPRSRATDEPGTKDAAQQNVTILAAARIRTSESKTGPEGLAGEGVEVHLSRQAPPGLTVQISPRESSPDTWDDAGAVPAGAQRLHLVVSLPGGSRIRLCGLDLNGTAWFSPMAFVSDPDRVQRRHTGDARTSKTYRTTPLDLFGHDAGFLAAVLDDLTRFASETQAARGPIAAGSHGEHEETPGSDDSAHHGARRIEPWLWIQDDTMQRLGPALGGFALGLPPLTAGNDPTLSWADRLTDETDLGLEDDTAETAANPFASEEPTPDEDVDPAVDHDDTTAGPSNPEAEPTLDQRNDPTSLRSARRRWCSRATALVPDLSIGSRLFVLRTVLRVWSAGNWDADDSEPLELLDQLLRALDQSHLPREAEARVGSMVAVALTLTRAGVDLRSHNDAHLRYRHLVENYSHLLLAADPDVVEEYTTGLATVDGVTLRPESVADTCADLTAEDPLADVEETLTQDGHDVTRPAAHLLRVTGRFTNPEPIALRAVGQSESHSGIGVWAANHAGDWTLVVWRKPDLVTITQRNGSQRWRHQVLTGHLGPAAVAYQHRTGAVTTQYDLVTRPKHQPTEKANAVLAAVGITEPIPPDK